MNLRKIFSLLFVVTLLVSLVPTLGLAQDVPATGAEKTAADQADTPAAPPGVLKPVVSLPLRHDVSPPLQSMKPIPAEPGKTLREIPRLSLPKTKLGGAGGGPLGPILQDWPGTVNMPPTIQNFEGVDNVNGVLPPDTNGDVGPNHYVQWVNLSFAIWDKTGTLLYGPVNGNTLWQGFGGVCETTNDGDPITLYDPIADRWLMSQFAFPTGSYHQCIAISQTPDPTGAWYRYDYQVSTTKMNDYPKFGIWPDAYYMTANQFTGGVSWGGAGVWAFERDKMLQGQAAQMVYFDLYSVNSNFGGMLPADLDGSTLPPSGAPGLFIEWDDSSWMGDPDDTLRLWEFHVDWTTPANSTFGVSGQPNYTIATTDVDPDMCGGARNCIPQPGGTALDAIADRLMYRLQYRNFDGYQTLVSNHTVDVNSSDHAGVHWFELRDDGSGWAMHQEGVYAPDSDNRWMGSVALDQRGNMAVGYSVSSSSTYPSIRYAGRLAGDPLGTLPQAEATLIAGSGYQQHSASRWGDYSMLAVDPVDDCTFWFTTEYYATIGSAPWQTRIGSFQFPSCLGATGTLSGTVTESGSGTPIVGAKVTAQTNPTFVTYSQSPNGAYTFAAVPTGTYTVTAEAYGYLPQTFSGIDVLSGTVTTQDFGLNVAPSYVISGYVTDATTGWPLYASIDIDGYPGDPIWADPASGFYSITLVSGITYTFDVEAWVAGYVPESRDVPVTSDATEDFALDADLLACTAPGYELNLTGLYETFDATTTPAGWTVIDNASTGAVWVFDDPGGRGNLTGGAGNFAIVDSDDAGSIAADTELRTPSIDLSALTSVTLEFKYDFRWYTGGGDEVADVDVSVNGAAGPWTNVWTRSGADDRGPKTATIDISAIAAGQSNVMVRFHYYDANFDWWWQVDDVFLGERDCNLLAGGLVVGNVYDDNTGDPLVGADVENEDGYAMTTVTTPDDPAVDDAFYTLFSPQGSKTFTATMTNYAPDVVTVTVVQSDTVSQDFSLSTGYLSYTPPTLEASLDLGLTTTVPFTLSNNGGAVAGFELQEQDQGFQPTLQASILDTAVPVAPAAPAPRITSRDECAAYENYAGTEPAGYAEFCMDDVHVPAPAVSDLAPLAPTDIAFAQDIGYISDNFVTFTLNDFPGQTVLGTTTDAYYGMDFDPSATTLYALNDTTDQLGTINLADGTFTALVPCPAPGGNWTGLSIDPVTGVFYASDVTSLYTIDPTTGASTLVGPFGTSLMIDIAVNTAGEMYGHDIGTDSIYQIDPTTGVATLIGPTGYNANYAQGMDFDNDDGTLYIFLYQGSGANVFGTVDLSTGAVTPLATSNPQGEFEGAIQIPGGSDVPWLDEDPITGTVDIAGQQAISVTFDAGVPEITQPGTYYAQLKVDNDTPYDLDNVPVTMTVLAPADWGKLNGTVTGLGYCDADPGPLEDAQVHIQSANASIITTTVLTEDFEAWLPTGWITVTNGGCGDWESTATTGRTNYAGGDGEAADADSDWCGSAMDTELWTPATDLSGYDEATLDFVAAFNYLSSGDSFEVDVSSDGGVTWTNVLSWAEDHGLYSGEAVNIDLTPYLSNQVVVRFHYVASGWNWYAEVDQVRVTGSTIAGGIWDLETDANGYYQVWMDESYSPLTVTVTYPDHETGLAPSLMVTGQMTTTQDFDLRWLVPCVSAEPDSLHATVSLGLTTTLPITLSNAGAVSTTVAMTELDRGFVPVVEMTFDENRPQGAAPVAAALATSLDQFAARNLAYKDLIVAPNAPTQDLLLDQPPNQSNGLFSDASCDGCTTGQQSIAENFVLSAAKGIGQIVFWTGYHPGDTPIDPDHITVIFHQDAGGLPGAAIYTENDVAYDRVQTGVVLFGVHEWMHTLTLASPVFLAPGTYWVEIYNDTGSGTDDFFWETGDLDATNGVAGSAWATTVPGSGWTADGATDLAIQLIEAVGAVPWLDEDPVASDVAADIGSQVVTVTFDAGVPEVDQPGDYLATLHAKSDDPVNGDIAIPVTMTVTAPASWGKLNGTVTGLGYCDADPGLLEGAQVHVQSSQVDTMTIVVSTTLLTEDFETWLPTGWITVSNGGDCVWESTATTGRTNYAGGDGEAADADADWCGSGTTMDTELWSPVMDLSGYDAASLDLVAVFRYLSGDYFEMDVSSNGGTTWTNVLHWVESHDATGPGEAVSIDLTPYLSNQVVVRFHYVASGWNWYAEVDQVRVTGYNDVEVQQPVFWDLETDANGYYQVWMDEGYSPVTVTVTIPDHENGEAIGVAVTGQTTTTQDFDLRWLKPCVSADPLSIETTVVRGTSETLSLDLNNNGALSTTFEMQELEGTRQLADILTFEEQVPQESTAPVVAALATSLDQFAARNLAYKDLIVVPNVLAQNLLLDQPPNQSNGLFSDAGCDGCTTGQQAVAENFNLSAATAIGQIVFWSGYSPGDTPVDPDHITVIFHQDAGGLPGAAIYTENDVAYDRVQTGVTLFGVHEWMHTLTLASPVPLAPGTYWVEIYNDTGTDDFFWEAGDLDATHGAAGMAWAAAAPGSGWTFDGATDLAIQLIEAGDDVPWLDETPITGTLNVDSSVPVSITFTALPTMTGGIYTATVVAETDDPVHGSLGVPVTMTVVYAPVCDFETSSPDDLGLATVFTNTTDEGYAATTYRWDFGDGSGISAATNPTHTYDLPGLYTTTLTAENPYGANVCTTTVSVEGVVAGFTSNSSVVLGEPVIFTNTTISNPGIVQWLWTFGDGGLDSTETPTHTYTVAGTYTVTLFAALVPGGPNSPEMPENVYDFYVGTVQVVTSRYQIYLPLVNKSY